MASKGKLLFGGIALLAVAGAAIVTFPQLTGQKVAKPSEISTIAGGPTVLRRLTQTQYQHVIADVFGGDITIGGRFEPDIRDSGLIEVGAGKVSVPASGLEQYGKMARSISAQVFDKAHRDSMVGCKPAAANAPDDACAGQFVTQVGRLLYRRPLTQDETADLVRGAAEATRTVGDFYGGLQITLTTMLQAPQFLFNWETSVADRNHPGQFTLNAYSKASRLSFFLWNSAPDDMLLTAAETGALDTEAGFTRQVDRMLASPRLGAGARAHFARLFQFHGFNKLSQDPNVSTK